MKIEIKNLSKVSFNVYNNYHWTKKKKFKDGLRTLVANSTNKQLKGGYTLDFMFYFKGRKLDRVNVFHYAKISYNDTVIKRWSERKEFRHIEQSHIGNITLPAGQSVLPVNYKGEHTSEILAADPYMYIELCYCSIYDDCWVVDRNNNPKSVEACSIDESQMFLQ